MRTRSTLLSKTCPYCGARSVAEARLPVATSLASVEYNLDHLDKLVESESLGFLLALVELLPYKTFTCKKCRGEFRLENATAKEIVKGMLSGLKPVIPMQKPKKPVVMKPQTAPRPAGLGTTGPAARPAAATPPRGGPEWSEPESLDALFDYSVDDAPKE